MAIIHFYNWVKGPWNLHTISVKHRRGLTDLSSSVSVVRPPFTITPLKVFHVNIMFVINESKNVIPVNFVVKKGVFYEYNIKCILIFLDKKSSFLYTYTDCVYERVWPHRNSLSLTKTSDLFLHDYSFCYNKFPDHMTFVFYVRS